MGAPYSLALWKRVVGAIKGGMFRNQAAKQFGVAISTAINWARSITVRYGSSSMPRSSASKKAWWLANAIVLTWRGGAASGRSIKIASMAVRLVFIDESWTIRTWRLRGIGAARRCWVPRFRTGAGRP